MNNILNAQEAFTAIHNGKALTNAVYAHQCMTAYEQRKQQLTQA